MWSAGSRAFGTGGLGSSEYAKGVKIRERPQNKVEPPQPPSIILLDAEFISTKNLHFQLYKGSYYPKKFKVHSFSY